MSVSTVIKKIFYIKDTEDNTIISIPLFLGSDKNVLSFVYLAASASPKISGGGFGE